MRIAATRRAARCSWPTSTFPAVPLLLFALTGGAACSGDVPAPTRPNLLLVTVDTLRADRLACYGGEAGVGASICSLAERGTRFEWALSAAPYTAPSVASILTSRYPSDHRVTQSALSFLGTDFVTVAEVLQDAGYTTAAFVSNPVIDRTRNLGQGFSVWDQRMTRQERNRRGFAEREARATTDAALAWARVGAKEPWFLWVHFQDPHGPYEPPEGPERRGDVGPTLPVLGDHSGYRGIPAYQALPGVEGTGSYERAYRDEIEYLDPHLQRLVDGLDALGRPLHVLLTSDHGEAFGEDEFWFAHGHSVGLDQIRVPLLWRPATPGSPRVVEAPVTLLDVAPTLVRLAGLDPPAEFAGRPLPLEGEAPGERTIFAEHEQRIAIVVGRAYYARDQRPVGEGERDRTSGGLRVVLPARTAHLGTGDAAGRYDTIGDDSPALDLDPLVEAHLAGRRGEASVHQEPVSDETRERLRALGYLD
jgi:arylsulfatase A-like enzyme